MKRPALPTGYLPETYLADACVLYSRVLRDYLLYAMRARLIRITWSQAILAEVTEHLMKNRAEFDQAAANRLTHAMNSTFPHAQIDARDVDYQVLASVDLPDNDDRHVIAAALAAEARFICTHDVGHFPHDVMSRFDIAVVTPDDVLCPLIRDHESSMLWAHQLSIESLPGATDESTIIALRKAGAPETAGLMSAALEQ